MTLQQTLPVPAGPRPTIRRRSRRLQSPQYDEMMRRRRTGRNDAAGLIRFRKTRLHEIEQIISARYGRTLPTEIDDCDLDFGAVFIQFAAAQCPPGQDVFIWLRRWLEKWAPGWLNQIEPIVKVAHKLVFSDSEDAARRLKVTFEERQRLGLKTIGACDLPKKQRQKKVAAIKRERDRQRAEDCRRAKSVIPRDLYEASSASRQKPWEAQGISRATYYRRHQAAARTIAETA